MFLVMSAAGAAGAAGVLVYSYTKGVPVAGLACYYIYVEAKNKLQTSTAKVRFFWQKSKNLQFFRPQKAIFLINNVPIKQNKTL